MKIIQILPHSLSKHKNEVDPRFYEDDWHVRVAKQIKKLTDKYEIECWRPEKCIKNIYTRSENNGITYKIFPSSYFMKFENSPQMLKNLEKISSDENIFHLHGIIYPFSYLILKKLQKSVPIVVQSHEASPTLTQTIISRYSNKYAAIGSFPIKFVESTLQKRWFNKIDYFFCLNQKEKNAFSKFGGKAIIQPMGIDFNKFKPMPRDFALKKAGIDNKRYLLYVGRLDKRKGLENLLEGFEKISKKHDITLLIVGDGPFEKKLRFMTKKFGISSRVNFLGNIPNELLPYYYNISEVTIFPSEMEAHPIVPIESLACETPLITTNVGAINEITKNFKGGYRIITLNDSDAILNAFKSIYSDPNVKSLINRKNAAKFYNWTDIIKKTIKTYEKLYEEYYQPEI
jgi:glycosyltransferase involved in cell wall biosynthesis